MYMCITFANGTKPYIMYGDKVTVTAEYRWYEQHYGDCISVLFSGNGLECRKAGGNSGWCIGKYFDGAHHTIYYRRLGDALRRLQRSDITVSQRDI